MAKKKEIKFPENLKDWERKAGNGTVKLPDLKKCGSTDAAINSFAKRREEAEERNKKVGEFKVAKAKFIESIKGLAKGVRCKVPKTKKVKDTDSVKKWTEYLDWCNARLEVYSRVEKLEKKYSKK